MLNLITNVRFGRLLRVSMAVLLAAAKLADYLWGGQIYIQIKYFLKLIYQIYFISKKIHNNFNNIKYWVQPHFKDSNWLVLPFFNVNN
jgi:hypothetical protein